MAADDNTLVVSWNDAADIQLCVPSDALVIPSSSGAEVAEFASLNSASFLSLRLKMEFSSLTSRRLTICPALSFPESPGSLITFLSNIQSFSSKNSNLSTVSSSRNLVSPGSTIVNFRIICRTITSMCLSLILTPCNLYTSWISFTTYSWTANGPLMDRISDGEVCPSLSCEPALMKSPSCARICLVNGTRYFLTTPSFASTIISRLPRLILPNDTTPSISETMAGLTGLLASNSS